VLAPVLAEHCNTKGKIALSGILQSQEEAIKKNTVNGLIFNPRAAKMVGF
jgi:ribosomal protein L11 methylase PrmA